MAVSPPMSLLFDAEAIQGMNGQVLVVSGSRDWVVPPGPEAIWPMAAEVRNGVGGYRLVLAKGGDHFNLGARYEEGGGPLRGLLLAWVNGAFAAGAVVAPGSKSPALLPPDGWGMPASPWRTSLVSSGVSRPEVSRGQALPGQNLAIDEWVLIKESTMGRFAGIDLISDRIPDETTILSHSF